MTSHHDRPVELCSGQCPPPYHGRLPLLIHSRFFTMRNYVAIDLAEAYFHVAIYPAHRKFLKFARHGAAYKFQRILLGMSLALPEFSKCMEAALFSVRNSDMRIFSYIDDYLVCFNPRQQVISNSVTVLNHLRNWVSQ